MDGGFSSFHGSHPVKNASYETGRGRPNALMFLHKRMKLLHTDQLFCLDRDTVVRIAALAPVNAVTRNHPADGISKL